MHLSDCRILVSLPAYGGQLTSLLNSCWTKLLRWASDHNVHLSLQSISNESLLPRARNQGVSKLLETPDFFTHILFLDADMGFKPDLLGRLIRFDKEVVGAPGPTKYIHWDQLSEAMLNGKNPEYCTLRYAVNFLKAGKINSENGFAKVKDFGCCFTLVKTGAILKMVEKYPDLRCDGMSWVNGAPTPHANNFAFFDTHVDEEGRYLECDHAFFARWRATGGDVWADLTSDLIHVGTHQYRGNMSHFFFGRSHDQGTLNAEHTPWGDSWDKMKAPAPLYQSEIEDIPKDCFHVTIIRPEGNNFPLCYKEQAKAIQRGLQDLGLDCTMRQNRLEEDRINIVFGWHMWTKEHPLLTLRRYRIILYQGEQLSAGGRVMPDWYFRSMKEALAVWDYSPENIFALQPHGHAAQLVPPGWHEGCDRIPYEEAEKDIDVLFIGVLNLRREFMLKLIGSVCNCQAMVDVWGEERDSMIARAKLVINVHYYPSATLELLRLSHLLASGVPVISEESDSNPYGDGIEMVPYRSILPAVLNHLMDNAKRLELGQRGRQAFERTNMADTLREALSALPSKETILDPATS